MLEDVQSTSHDTDPHPPYQKSSDGRTNSYIGFSHSNLTLTQFVQTSGFETSVLKLSMGHASHIVANPDSLVPYGP